MSDHVSAAQRRAGPRFMRLLPWLITIACFALLYTRIDGAAQRQGSSALPYLMQVFEKVDWWRWLALMIPYSVLFFFVDSLVIWRVVNWFNAKVPYRDILPVRASTYILSILNEQIGKGVMAYYLNRRDGVPGWQVGSSMLFVMFCEFYYLLTWACVGAALRWERVPEAFRALPWVALGALVFFARVDPLLPRRDRARPRSCASATCCARSGWRAVAVRESSWCCARRRCSRRRSSTRTRCGSSASSRASSRCSACCR